MSLKKIIGKIHLWLGLSTGLVVFIVAITGAIWAFQEEITDWLNPRHTLASENRDFLPPSILSEKAKGLLQKEITGLRYQGKNKPAAVFYFKREEDGTRDYRAVLLNPYTAEIIDFEENKKSFFDIVIGLHINLLLGDIGNQIVLYSTLLFFVILVSGIILWWPKNYYALKQRLWFKWKNTTKYKRKNYDLHNILGFYACFIVIFALLTGLAWGFTWVDSSVQSMANGFKSYPEKQTPQSKSALDYFYTESIPLIDKIYYTTIANCSFDIAYMNIRKDLKPDAPFRVYVSKSNKYWYHNENFYFDQRTGELLQADHYADSNHGEKLQKMYYDLHVGSIIGLPGRILMFIACLIVASLPITGFLIWWGRGKKIKPRSKPVSTLQIDTASFGK